MPKIYFDYASTTPIDPAVIKAMEPFFFEKFGNASSPHVFGREAKKALEDAREFLAKSINAVAEEVIFTSGATESNNHALIGAATANVKKGKHIIVSQIEHHSVLEPVALLQKQGFKVTFIRPDSKGVIDPEDIIKAITDKTIIVSVMHASNEIGTIQPVEQIGKICREKEILFHVDSVQTVGHIPVDIKKLNCDFLSLSAHKFYGPKGVGALYIRKKAKLDNFLLGGDQEQSRRASTQNVAGAVGLAKALEICIAKMPQESETQIKLRDSLISKVPQLVEGVIVNGHLTERLPNNAHFSFEKVQGESLLMSLDMVDIAASMGSACTSGALEPSHVLRAIGLSDELALGSLRISLGRWNQSMEIDYFLSNVSSIIQRLRV